MLVRVLVACGALDDAVGDGVYEALEGVVAEGEEEGWFDEFEFGDDGGLVCVEDEIDAGVEEVFAGGLDGALGDGEFFGGGCVWAGDVFVLAGEAWVFADAVGEFAVDEDQRVFAVVVDAVDVGLDEDVFGGAETLEGVFVEVVGGHDVGFEGSG